MSQSLRLLLGAVSFLSLGSPAYAQMPMQLFEAGRAIGRYTNKQLAARPVSIQDYRGKQYPMQRTPLAQLPRQEAELITALEAKLDQCHTAMLADATGPVCPPDQHFALQGALASLMRARLHWSTAAYEQEMAFYFAEDARRQQAAAPAEPAK